MTVKEILEIINQYDYDEAAPLLETILSEHLRGKVYLGLINKYVEELYFNWEYDSHMYQAFLYPQDVLNNYTEHWGFNELVKYLSEREDNERTLRL